MDRLGLELGLFRPLSGELASGTRQRLLVRPGRLLGNPPPLHFQKINDIIRLTDEKVTFSYSGSSNDNFGVTAKILRQCTNADKSLRLPNKEELASMLINADFNAQERLAGNASRVYVASQAGSGLPWSVDGTEVAYTTLAYYYRVRCIER